jgi:hypothetical protein
MKNRFITSITQFLYKGLLVTGSILTFSSASAQQVTATAQTDSSLMFIGGQMNLTLEVTQPLDITVAFPEFSDTITENIEVVDIATADTTINNQMMTIRKTYTITSFDSGLHYIPPIEFQYMDEQMQRKAITRSLGINVINPFEEVDPEKGIFDIKQPYNLPFTIEELKRFLFWLLLFFLVQALIGIGYVFWQRRDKPIKSLFVKEKPKEPPHIIALKALDKIKEKKLWQNGHIKTYYSELTEILRRYMEERYDIQTMEKTSDEILLMLKKIELPDDKLFGKIKTTFLTADLAKFAKYEPLPDENDISLINAFFFVNQTKEEPKPEVEEAAKASIEKETKEGSRNK